MSSFEKYGAFNLEEYSPAQLRGIYNTRNLLLRRLVFAEYFLINGDAASNMHGIVVM